RVRRHRAARPAGWRTVEEPLELEAALAGVPEDACALVDCLTLWVSNLLEKGLTDEQVTERAPSAAAAAARRAGPRGGPGARGRAGPRAAAPGGVKQRAGRRIRPRRTPPPPLPRPARP